MNRTMWLGLVAGILLSAGMALAETKVELKGVHLCCKACTNAVGDILKGVDGVKGACDVKGKTVTVTAQDDKAAQKALDALPAGGFHGDTGNADLTIRDASGAPQGQGSTRTLSGAPN